jgi:hypothetical protein
MAATHHGFNILKIPGANGTITVRYNEKDALRSVEHVYREAAAMFPADEDLLEHFGDLTRKKQLVSQERATTKKASLEPHLPSSIGKKFTVSASPTPSEDLVHPMLDMSIGEATVPLGRRPQFTQERSATKKVLLQAGGYENFVTIGAGLSPKEESALVTFLWANSDMFASTSSDMPGVPRKVIEHHLAVCPQAQPVK